MKKLRLGQGSIASQTVSQEVFQAGSAVKGAALYSEEHKRTQKPSTCSTRANLEPGWLVAQGGQAHREAFPVMDEQWAGPVDSDSSLLCDLAGALCLSVERVPACQSVNPRWAPMPMCLGHIPEA